MSNRWRLAALVSGLAFLVAVALLLGGGRSPTAVATPSPTLIAPANLALDELAWWDLEQFGFGFTEPPPPDAPMQPAGGRLVHLGTLDGRVTAAVLLNEGWSHSYVRGPVGTDILLANDDGRESTVFVISALDGHRTELLRTNAIMPAAVLSPDGSTLYYGVFDRHTGADGGLWRRPRAGGAETRVLGPLGEAMATDANNLVIWRLTFSLDGSILVAQSCFGEVQCTSHVLDIATGTLHTLTGIGWIQGVTATQLVAYRVGGHEALLGIDLHTLAVTPFAAGLHSLSTRTGERLGFALPDGWALGWPDRMWDLFNSLDAQATADLSNLRTGESVVLNPFRAVAAEPECELLVPVILPSGSKPGASIPLLEDGHRGATWGSGPGEIREEIEPVPAAHLGTAVHVRGVDGVATVAITGLTSRGVIAWDDGACGYRVWLAAGTTLEDAVRYAPAF